MGHTGPDSRVPGQAIASALPPMHSLPEQFASPAPILVIPGGVDQLMDEHSATLVPPVPAIRVPVCPQPYKMGCPFRAALPFCSLISRSTQFHSNSKKHPHLQNHPKSMENDCLSLFSDPQHQLFCCSLLQPLQSSLPAMSSSALFFPAAAAPRSSAASRGFGPTSAGSPPAAELANGESEFSFLESKPSFLVERANRGGKAYKGRRNAGVAVLRRKLANQAFLVKIATTKEFGCGKRGCSKIGCNGGCGGQHGGRRRVLSELVADQFAPSVPYSLNRKSRWSQEGTEWLTELAGGCTGQKLRLSVAEADYSLDGTESVRAFHRLDAAKGRLQSRWAKSGRGALLADLMKSGEEEEEELENAEPIEQMHFQLTRPHSTSHVFAGKFFKRKPFVRSTKRTALEISGPSTGPIRTTFTRCVPITESEPEEENEFLAQYRPRRETYSLADFLKDNPTAAPVMVRRPANNNCPMEDDQQFAIVPDLECVELPDMLEPTGATTDTETGRPQCPALAALRQRASSTADGFFRQFPMALAATNPTQIGTLAECDGQWQAHWLGEQLLLLDLSKALSGGVQAKEAEGPSFVLVLSPGELLVNSLIPLDEQKLAQCLKEGEGLEQKVRALLEIVRTDFAEWHLSRQRQQVPPQMDHLRSVFHSPRLSLALHPLSVRAVFVQQQAEQQREESQFVGAEELLAKEEAETLGEDGDEDEEFELIDMNELIGGSIGKPSTEIAPNLSAPKCADCSNSLPSLATLRSCGHRLCRDCLTNGIGQQRMGEYGRLHCTVCPGTLPLVLLPWLLPLPTANALILLQHAEQAIQAGQQLAQCPACQGLLELGQQVVEFGQLGCVRCSLHWCPKCNGAPHWPLSCAQNGEWARRARPNEEETGQLPNLVPGQPKAPIVKSPPPISGQFADVCVEARARRLDARLGWQLGKHMRRLGGSQAERRFGQARKTALHLLEFGTAWLYIHRQQRPPGWAQLKSLLWALRERVECLDNELLFSGSLTDSETLKTKLADLEQLGEKGLAKFGAMLKEQPK